MADAKKCPKCQSVMETGFIPDFSYGAVIVPRWHRGEPQPRSFLGIPVTSQVKVNYNAGYPVEAWRCPRCALVEFYAPEKAQA